MTQPSDLTYRILEGMTSVVLVLDNQLRLHYINPAGETLFSISARHLLQLEFCALIQNGEDLQRRLHETLRSGHPFTRHEVSINLGPEVDAVVDFTAIPLNDPGLPQAILVEMHQIDRLLRISREEHQITQQHASRKILRGLAHEIKNPLGGLRGAAQLLEQELRSDELREYTQVIINEADRLHKLVDRILGPNKPPHKRPVNIYTVIEHVRSLLMAEKKPGVRIRRDYDPSIPEVMADADQLVQAILNIANNAHQAVGDTGTITLRTRVERKFTLGKNRHDLVARIEVIDDGPGIAEDIRDNIFFPMVTGRAEGTGLGLSITQTLILQHDGIIEFKSIPGDTVFSVLLPITKEGSDSYE